MKITRIILVAISLMIWVGTAYSGPRKDANPDIKKKQSAKPDLVALHSCTSCHSLSREEAGAVFKGIGEIKEVRTSPVKGLYEVTLVAGDQQVVAYLDFKKKLLMPGPIIDLASRRPITPPPVVIPKKISAEKMRTIPIVNSLIMGKPDGKIRMFVFTDPDCPFCGRLHAELKKLVAMEPDLTIYIKMFPLKNHPNAYDKARVILGENSIEILEKAFAGEKLRPAEDKDPKGPVDETIKLGESLGVDGTPAILLPDGRLYSGFMDARRLRGYLMESAKDKK